jgi:carbon monoxide dehydrogenase subunit G
MKISHEFVVARPVDQVWDYFQDVPSVADCLPGAELLEDKGDGKYSGKVSVKLGPMAATFEGDASVTPDAAAKSGKIDGKGADRRGGSRGQVKVDYKLEAEGSGTKVNLDADVTLSGAAAQFGRTGLINEISGRLIEEFVECVEAKLAATTVEEAAEIKAGEVSGFAVFIQGLIAWIKKLFKRGD